MMNLKKAIVYTCTLATVLGVIGQAEAAQVDMSAQRRSHDFGPSYESQARSNTIRLAERLNRSFRGENTLYLKQILNIGPQQRGMTLEKIILVGSAKSDTRFDDRSRDRGHDRRPPQHQEKAMATLLINGYQVDTQSVSSYSSQTLFFPNPNENIIGSEVNTIQLKLQGDFEIKEVIAVLSEPQSSGHGGHGPRIHTFSKDIQQNFRNRSTLAVRNLLSLGAQHKGDKVTKVTLKAESAQGKGQATLLINGIQIGMTQTVGRWLDTLEFEIPSYAQELGEDIQNLKIKLQGNIYVDSLQALVQEGSSAGNGSGDWGQPTPPSHGGQLSARPFQLVSGESSLSLASLVNASRSEGSKKVSTVTIEAVAGVRGEIQLCSVGRFQTCTEMQIVRGSSRAVFNLRGMNDLQDIRVKTKGNMTIKTVKIML